VPTLPPAPQQDGRVISIGERVEETLRFNGDGKVFQITPSSEGTLIVRVSWDTTNGRLELWYGDRGFVGDGLIVAKLPVMAGKTYRVSVDDGAPWDYGGLSLPFVLTTSLE
jgi:hypothetical protein